jgi:hypothetical protein
MSTVWSPDAAVVSIPTRFENRLEKFAVLNGDHLVIAPVHDLNTYVVGQSSGSVFVVEDVAAE